MNIMLFLTPKSEVAFLNDDFTIRQALEKMEYHRYTAIPILSREGKYIGTLTEGDLLWAIKNDYNLDLKKAENIKVLTVKRLRDNKAVFANTQMDALFDLATMQNFVPILDDGERFIGLITRKDIMKYFFNKHVNKELV